MRGNYKVWFSNDSAGNTILTPEKTAEGDAPYWIGLPNKQELIYLFNYGTVIMSQSPLILLQCLIWRLWNDGQGYNNSFYGTGWGKYENILVNKAKLQRLEKRYLAALERIKQLETAFSGGDINPPPGRDA